MTYHPQLPAIPQLRVLYWDESAVKLNSSRPPAFPDVDALTGIREEEGAEIGMNLSGPLVRLLDNPIGLRGLLTRWDRYCRGKHSRWADHAERPLCAELAWLTVRDRHSLASAAAVLDVSYERAGRLLAIAFRQMLHWDALADRLARDESHDPEFCPTCRQEAVG